MRSPPLVVFALPGPVWRCCSCPRLTALTGSAPAHLRFHHLATTAATSCSRARDPSAHTLSTTLRCNHCRSSRSRTLRIVCCLQGTFGQRFSCSLSAARTLKYRLDALGGLIGQARSWSPSPDLARVRAAWPRVFCTRMVLRDICSGLCAGGAGWYGTRWSMSRRAGIRESLGSAGGGARCRSPRHQAFTANGQAGC